MDSTSRYGKLPISNICAKMKGWKGGIPRTCIQRAEIVLSAWVGMLNQTHEATRLLSQPSLSDADLTSKTPTQAKC